MHTTTTEPDYATVADLTRELFARRVSAVELARAAIARIERLDARVNAVIVRDFERALDAAARADDALRGGARTPLLGVPMTVKESFDVAGLPKTWGMPAFAGWQAPEDAVAVARLRAAGAVILGKTNVPFALGDWQSYNELYGTTNNPWDLTRTPGGSSGGSAAAVAAGFVPLEFGSDIAGSLRAPAHFCGVYGHKPSRNVVPVRGNGLPRSAGLTPDLQVVGPIARTVADLALAFDVVSGPDAAEAVAFRLELPPARATALRDFRVLVLSSHPLLPASSAVRGALETLADRLRAEGAAVADAVGLVPDLDAVMRSFVMLLLPVVFARQPREAARGIEAMADALPEDAAGLDAWRLRALVARHRDWLAADEARIRFGAQWRALFRDWDVLLMPAMPTTAFPHDHTAEQHERRLDVDGTPFPYLDQTAYASLATPFGLPATVAPLSRSPEGLPIGVQIVGPYLEDRTPLAFAAALETAYGGFTAPPPSAFVPGPAPAA